MTFLRENKLLFGVIGIALAAGLAVCGIRWNIEAGAKTVDYVYDYNEMVDLAAQSDHDISWWLSEFKDMGLTKTGLQEETLLSLAEENRGVEAEMLCDVEKDAAWRDEYPQAVLDVIDRESTDDYDVIIKIDNDEMYDFVSRAFTERFESDRSVCIPQETGGYVFVNGQVSDTLYRESYKINEADDDGFKNIVDVAGSKIMYINLGLLPEKVKMVEDAGITVVPRTLAYEGWNDTKFVKDVTEQYEVQLGGAPQYMILASDVVPGYDDDTEFLSEYINDNDVIIGVVENNNQRQNIDPDGLDKVIEACDYNVVRVFSVWNYIQYRYEYYGYDGFQEIENSLFRPVIERNVRLVYFKPMKEKDNDHAYITDADEYREMFEGLNSRFASHGFTVGDASVMKVFFVPLAVRILAALAAVAAAVICFCTVFPVKSRKWRYGLFGAGAICVLGAFVVAPNLATLITALAVSIFVACLIVIWFVRYAVECRNELGQDAPVGRILPRSIIALIVTTVSGLATAFLMTSALSSTNFMLELDIFRGVKFAQVAVILFFMLMFFVYYSYLWGDKKITTLTAGEVRSLLRAKIEVWVIGLLGVMAVVGYIYLARTGNETDVEASSLELLMRNFLENALYARPRTKEFLAAFPSVMLFIYTMVKGYRVLSFVFGTAAAIGFTSVINTFMHIRSPLELGVARTGFSLLFGLVIGLVCLLILDRAAKLVTGMAKDPGNRDGAESAAAGEGGSADA